MTPTCGKASLGPLIMNYVIEGPDEAPVAMLAHGILTSLGMWDAVAVALASRWRVLRYDLRGHGKTSAPASPYAMSDLADDAVQLLDTLDIEKVHFVGSSLGGMIGQQIAARFPARLLSLTLANTTAVQGTPDAWEHRRAVAQAADGVGPLVKPTLQRWFTSGFLHRRPEDVSRMEQLAVQTSLPGFLGCAAAIRDLDQSGLLAAIAAPTLVVAGEHDSATPVSESAHLQRSISRAQLVVLPAAHQSAVECPEQFSAAWEEFCSAL